MALKPFFVFPPFSLSPSLFLFPFLSASLHGCVFLRGLSFSGLVWLVLQAKPEGSPQFRIPLKTRHSVWIHVYIIYIYICT